MIGNALERAIVRTLIGVLAERGLASIEEQDLVTLLMEAKLCLDPGECRSAIAKLKHAEIIQNGRGTRLNLSGIGLTLGGAISMPNDIRADIRAVMESILPPVVDEKEPAILVKSSPQHRKRQGG